MKKFMCLVILYMLSAIAFGQTTTNTDGNAKLLIAKKVVSALEFDELINQIAKNLSYQLTVFTSLQLTQQKKVSQETLEVFLEKFNKQYAAEIRSAWTKNRILKNLSEEFSTHMTLDELKYAENLISSPEGRKFLSSFILASTHITARIGHTVSAVYDFHYDLVMKEMGIEIK